MKKRNKGAGQPRQPRNQFHAQLLAGIERPGVVSLPGRVSSREPEVIEFDSPGGGSPPLGRKRVRSV